MDTALLNFAPYYIVALYDTRQLEPLRVQLTVMPAYANIMYVFLHITPTRSLLHQASVRETHITLKTVTTRQIRYQQRPAHRETLCRGSRDAYTIKGMPRSTIMNVRAEQTLTLSTAAAFAATARPPSTPLPSLRLPTWHASTGKWLLGGRQPRRQTQLLTTILPATRIAFQCPMR